MRVKSSVAGAVPLDVGLCPFRSSRALPNPERRSATRLISALRPDEAEWYARHYGPLPRSVERDSSGSPMRGSHLAGIAD
jgi:hypothetical protein